VGLGCAALVFCWQFLTVRYNYQGNWTGLFCTGSLLPQPPLLAAENIYRFAGSNGYDGQFYHYMAHDPFFRRGFLPYVEGPRFRYRRILIPLAAYLLSFGRDNLVDGGYFAVILLLVFCGAYWLSLYFRLHGFNPVWGLLFVWIPATVTSIDRMTVDSGLAALCIGFVLYAEEDSKWRTYAVLAAAALLRETGLVLVAGYVIYLVWNRRFRPALLFVTAAIPALAWYAFVWAHTSGEVGRWVTLLPTSESWFSAIPLKGLTVRMVRPYHYQTAPSLQWAVMVFDYVALLCAALAILVAIRLAWRRQGGPTEICIYQYALMAIFLSFQDAWTEVYGFGRILSPLLVLLGLHGLAKRNWIALLPILVVGARAVLQLAPQSLKILKAAL
jgi:hypothetical protein